MAPSLFTLGLSLAVVAATALATQTARSARATDDRVRDGYLVDLKPGVDPGKYARRIAADYGGTATFSYDRVLGGFAFQGPASSAKRLARDKRVDHVEQDRIVRAADDPPPGINHLSRDKVYEAQGAGYTGAGVTIAVLDTGVDGSHEVFRSHDNVLPGYGACGGTATANDRNGHGTATASNAVGLIGVAHEAKVLPVKVFPGTGVITTWSRVICGLNYVDAHHSEIDVVNMSIAGPGVGALNRAVQRVISDGIVVVAAAGNVGGATQAPARYAGVLAASALDGGNMMASWSSTGDITAPGVNIYSANKNGTYLDRSGTSRSAPQVAGAAAIILSEDPSADVLDVLRRSGTCPDGQVNGSSGFCAGRWDGDDANAEPLVNAYCAGILADPVAFDVPACGF
jgi:subtilisin family serine protease